MTKDTDTYEKSKAHLHGLHELVDPVLDVLRVLVALYDDAETLHAIRLA